MPALRKPDSCVMPGGRGPGGKRAEHLERTRQGGQHVNSPVFSASAPKCRRNWPLFRGAKRKHNYTGQTIGLLGKQGRTNYFSLAAYDPLGRVPPLLAIQTRLSQQLTQPQTRAFLPPFHLLLPSQVHALSHSRGCLFGGLLCQSFIGYLLQGQSL